MNNDAKTKETPVCVVEICRGYCCENISTIVKINLEKLGLKFEPNGIDKKDNRNVFRCIFHDKETGLCKKYESRPWYCDFFFCESATEGFMRRALEHMSSATTNRPLFDKK